MLEYSDIREGKFIIFNGEPYEVIHSHVFRKQQRKPVNATKLRNIISGRIVENSFHVSEKAEEADLSNRPIKYLYSNRGQWWFSEAEDASKRFELPEAMIGSRGKFLRQNSLVDALIWNDEIIGLKLPIKVELEVKEAHPAVKGNTSQNATKEVVLETGATIQVPMFIKEGDTIRVNTETESYADRV